MLNDVPLHKLPLRKVARTVALVPQQLDVPFQFTVREVVEQGRTPYLGFLRGPMSEDRIAVDRALDLADVTGLATANLQRTERRGAPAREDCARPRAGTEAAAAG